LNGRRSSGAGGEGRDKMVAMRVRVLFFGQLKEIAGVEEEGVELREGARVADLFAQYAQRFPRLEAFLGVAIAAVNQEFAPWEAPVAEGDEVAFLPPVSGGAGESRAADSGDVCTLVRERIATEQIVGGLKAPEDGAVAVFEGIVRNHSRGRETLYLEYEAYEPMALAQMREIAAEMLEKFAVRRVAMVHRLGRIEIGETSVLIVVASAHRAAAFDACRYGIDTLKWRVPIWKKEYFADGAVWAEGETPAEKAFSSRGESKAK
jgi:MoaE-MoaD fusion protein